MDFAHFLNMISFCFLRAAKVWTRIFPKFPFSYNSIHFSEAGGGVVSRTETLQRISEEIDQLKQQIEAQGARNVDGGMD